MVLKIVGVIRNGLDDYADVLPEKHSISAARLASLLEAGLLYEEAAQEPKAEPTEPKIRARVGVWDLDPDGLKGMSLVRLNTIVAERGGEEKFETVEGAIFFLTKDFQG